MYTIRRITTATLALLCLAVAYLSVAASASAEPIEPGAGVQGAIPVPPQPTPTSIVVNNGSPWWTFVLVALAGAAFAVAAGLLVARLRHARSGSARHNLVATSH
jgi:ABC-type branched-subunit amino acid transport system permease subunit